MKKLIIILGIIALIAGGCGQIYANHTGQDSILVSIGDTKLILWGLPAEDFDVEIEKDTIFLRQKGFEEIDNLQIFFLSDDHNNGLMKGEIIYGVAQYLFDDMGYIPLNFSFKDSILISKTDNKYAIQQVIKDRELMRFFFEKIFFEEIKKESYAFQKRFYQEVIDYQEKWECCPEYIEKAKQFMYKEENDFHTIEDLSLEVVYKKIVLELGFSTYLVFYNEYLR